MDTFKVLELPSLAMRKVMAISLEIIAKSISQKWLMLWSQRTWLLASLQYGGLDLEVEARGKTSHGAFPGGVRVQQRNI